MNNINWNIIILTLIICITVFKIFNEIKEIYVTKRLKELVNDLKDLENVKALLEEEIGKEED